MTRVLHVNHCPFCGHRVRTSAPLQQCQRCLKPLQPQENKAKERQP